MHTHRPTTRRAKAHGHRPWAVRPGFSMMEVLVALGIFVLGFVAIAAIFPSAALLQRRAADDIQSRHVQSNARDTISQTRLAYSTGTTPELSYYYDNGPANPVPVANDVVRPFNGGDSGTYGSLNDIWSLGTRSYPASQTEQLARRFYWVPLLRDANLDSTAPDWQIIVFVLRREPDTTYTENKDGNTEKTFATGWASKDEDIDGSGSFEADELGIPSVKQFEINDIPDSSTFELVDSIYARQNDWLIDSNGKIYRVATPPATTPTHAITVDSQIAGNPAFIWFAPPPDTGEVSSAVSVFQIPMNELNNVGP